MPDFKQLTDDMRDELARDFMNEYGVSESTATMATNLFITIASSMPEAQADVEFQRAIQQMVTQGESWAAEFVQATFNKQLPGFRVTYQRALTSGQDPAAALVREHAMPGPAAAEVVALLKTETAKAKQANQQRQQQETPTGRPYLADINCPDGIVTVTVDPTVTVASATVTTDDTTGPSAEVARRATVRLNGDVLTVVVPKPKATVHNGTSFRNGTAYQNISYVGPGMTVTGVTIDGNGNMTIGGVSGGATSIKVAVTLPPGSGVKMRSYNASLTIRGTLAALDFDTHNGNLTAGVLGRVKARGHNGHNDVEAVQEWVDIETHNSDTYIGSYSGGAARLVTHNGSVELSATPSASGRIEARSHNGNLRLRGVSGRHDLDVSAKTRNGNIRKS